MQATLGAGHRTPTHLDPPPQQQPKVPLASSTATVTATTAAVSVLTQPWTPTYSRTSGLSSDLMPTRPWQRS